MGYVGVLTGPRTGPELEETMPRVPHIGAPQIMSQNERVSPAYAIPQRTWETSSGLPSTALTLQATNLYIFDQ